MNDNQFVKLNSSVWSFPRDNRLFVDCRVGLLFCLENEHVMCTVKAVFR